MSMLAEPRRKKHYVLNPRGKALYNDEDRFGSKMLQKMGWTKGKGLGAKESGSIDFVRVNFKSDVAGLGFEDRNDQWTEHEKGFNGLLNALQTVNVGISSGKEEAIEKLDDDDDALETVGFGFKNSVKKRKKLVEEISGQSLEEKSKQSKARVHYKKYTKGKDLSQYSEKELANIFGKKVDNFLESEKSDKNEEDNSYNILINDYSKKKTKTQNEQASFSNEESNMLQTSSTSINDYFKSKMQEKSKKKDKNNELLLQLENFDKNESLLPCTNLTKDKQRKRKTSTASDDYDSLTNAQEFSSKRKKEKINIEECNETTNGNLFNSELDGKILHKKKKNKGKKRNISEDNNLNSTETKICYQSTLNHDLNVSDAVNEKIKRKKKRSADNSYKDESKLHQLETKTDETENFENQNKRQNEKLTYKTNDLYVENNNINYNKNSKQLHQKEDNSNLNTDKTIINTTTNYVDGKEISTKESVVQFANKKAQPNKNIQSWEDFNKRYNICQISSFVAEKFRHFNACRFQNSNILEIDGYSLDKSMKLEIVARVDDENRIAQLWRGVINKYRKQDDKAMQKNVEQLPTSEMIKPENKNNQTKTKIKERLKILKKQKRKSVFKLGI